ncbi:conserved hypothetical protein [Ricinus communis]|uniref:Uncharacterized protein n=1 Tax=Ricinus communis TaxID=3988 RepID=B9T5F7_RICCO|nr:conserved hypothetical protein [Ricinus communis]
MLEVECYITQSWRVYIDPVDGTSKFISKKKAIGCGLSINEQKDFDKHLKRKRVLTGKELNISNTTSSRTDFDIVIR